MGRLAGRSWECAWLGLRSARLSPERPGRAGRTDGAEAEGLRYRSSRLKAERWARRCWVGRAGTLLVAWGPQRTEGRRQVQAGPHPGEEAEAWSSRLTPMRLLPTWSRPWRESGAPWGVQSLTASSQQAQHAHRWCSGVSSGDGSWPGAQRRPTFSCLLWLPLLGCSARRALPGSLFLPAHSGVALSGWLTSLVKQEHPLPPAAIAGFPHLLYLRKPLSKALPANDLTSPCSSPWNTSSLRTEAGLASGTLSILHGHLLSMGTTRQPGVFRSERGSRVCDAVGGPRG